VNRIWIAEPAVQDLEQIYDYIAADNVAAADGLKAKLQKRWRTAFNNEQVAVEITQVP